MQAKAELQVLDEPVRPVNTAGLTAQTTGYTNLAMKDDAITKTEDQDLKGSYNLLSKDYDRGAERNIRCMAPKYVLMDDEFYL